MATITIVDDHVLVAEILRRALAAHGIDADVVDDLDASRLIERLQGMAPRLVLLDLDLGRHGDSIGLIKPLARAAIRCLVVSGTTDRELLGRAFEAGAVGFHAKSDGMDTLVAKAQTALGGTGLLDEPLRWALRDELARARNERSRRLAPFERLTDREQATLRALGTGRSVQRIATDWTVSEATVRSHVRGVLDKLNAPSQLAAVCLAVHSGWLAAQADLAVGVGHRAAG